MTVNKGTVCYCFISTHIHWLHNGRDGVSIHQPYDCLLNRVFQRKSKKISKLRVTGFVRGIHRGPVNFPHKWPVARKMFPFYDVIMNPLLVLMYQSIRYYVPNLFHRRSNHSCILHPLSALYCAGSHYCSWNTRAHSLFVFNNTMAADGLVVSHTMASTVKIFI